MKAVTAVVESFTAEAGNEFLEDHVGETGASWEVSVAGALIVHAASGKLLLDPGVALGAIGWPSGAAALFSTDMSVSLDASYDIGAADTPVDGEVISVSIYFRWVRATNSGYCVRLRRAQGEADTTITLYRVVAGVETQLASFGPNAWTGLTTLTVICVGHAITISRNGAAVINYTAPAVDAGSAVGLRIADSVAGLANGYVPFVDNFSVGSTSDRLTSDWSLP